MIGVYGPWAAGLVGDGPARLSFRNPRVPAAETRRLAYPCPSAASRLPASTPVGRDPQGPGSASFDYDGLHVEHLSWQLPYGPPTEAVVLKPAGAKGRLPAVLALHDHGGNKYFGWRKIAQISDRAPPDDEGAS